MAEPERMAPGVRSDPLPLDTAALQLTARERDGPILHDQMHPAKISEKPVQLPSRGQILLATRSARRVPERACHSLTASALTWAQSERDTAAGSAETAA